MTTGQREAAAEALLSVVANAYPWVSPPSRRLRLWSEVGPAVRPTCFLFEGGSETVEAKTGLSKTVYTVRLFVYVDSRSKSTPGATALNTIVEAISAAMKPMGADGAMGRNTLGGTVHWARIEGETMKDPGDLDGDGIAVIPVRITLP